MSIPDPEILLLASPLNKVRSFWSMCYFPWISHGFPLYFPWIFPVFVSAGYGNWRLTVLPLIPSHQTLETTRRRRLRWSSNLWLWEDDFGQESFDTMLTFIVG